MAFCSDVSPASRSIVSGRSRRIKRTLLKSTEIRRTTRAVRQRSPIISSYFARFSSEVQNALWSIGGRSEWFMFLIARSISYPGGTRRLAASGTEKIGVPLRRPTGIRLATFWVTTFGSILNMIESCRMVAPS